MQLRTTCGIHLCKMSRGRKTRELLHDDIITSQCFSPFAKNCVFEVLFRHRAAIGLAGAIALLLFLKIVPSAVTNMALPTEIFSAPDCCI